MLSLFTNNSVKETKMKVFVTGVAGQLGHDIMNDLAARGYEGIGTDIASEYNGISDGTAVTRMPYVSLDITDRTAVEQVIGALKPDVMTTVCSMDSCRFWPRMMIKSKCMQSTQTAHRILQMQQDEGCQDGIYRFEIMYLTDRAPHHGSLTASDYAPLNVYGQTKLDGELAVANTLEKYFIVRIAWYLCKRQELHQDNAKCRQDTRLQ